MKWIFNALAGVFVLFVFIFSISLGIKTGNHSSFTESLKDAQGEVIAFDAGIMIVEFNKSIIKACGDTQVYGFVTTPSDLSIQLRPVFIPEAKADKVNDKTLVFPVWDVMLFMQDYGAYTIEFFIDNNCSLFHNQTITLPPVALVLGDNI